MTAVFSSLLYRQTSSQAGVLKRAMFATQADMRRRPSESIRWMHHCRRLFSATAASVVDLQSTRIELRPLLPFPFLPFLIFFIRSSISSTNPIFGYQAYSCIWGSPAFPNLSFHPRIVFSQSASDLYVFLGSKCPQKLSSMVPATGAMHLGGAAIRPCVEWR